MTNERLELLFELAEELYAEKQEESGMVTPIPFAWAESGGRLLVFSAFGHDSQNLAERLEIPTR